MWIHSDTLRWKTVIHITTRTDDKKLTLEHELQRLGLETIIACLCWAKFFLCTEYYLDKKYIVFSHFLVTAKKLSVDIDRVSDDDEHLSSGEHVTA